MTDYASVLKELMVAGYEGAHLLAAFKRMCAAISMDTRQGNAVADSRPATQPAKKSAITAKSPRPRPVVYAPPKNAKAIGRAALAAVRIPGSTIKIGSRLLEHYNLETGLCYPGHASLSKALGIPLRTVQRGVQRLVEVGLFTVGQNAGRAHTNMYFPVWPRMVELAESDSLSPPLLTHEPAKSGGQNQRRKPDIPSVVGKAQRTRRKAVPDHRQRELVLLRTMDGGRSGAPIAESAQEATRARLFRQLDEAVRNAHPGDKAAYVSLVTRANDVDFQPIVAAEMARKGSGLAMLLDAVGLTERRRATGR